MANPIAKFEKAFRRDPDSPLFARLADLYLKDGDIEHALELCEKGCATFPEYSTGFVVLSKCYEKQGNVEKAREAMGHVLRLDPENPGGYKRLSDLFQQLGVFPLALQSLQQAAYLDPFDNTLDEQIDYLNYQARKESTEERPLPGVAPLTAQGATPIAAETTEILTADQAQATDVSDEATEPLAQVPTLPEWSDTPDVSEALKESEQGPNPLSTESPSDCHDDVVAALGTERFGSDISESSEGTDTAAPLAPQAPTQIPELEKTTTAEDAPEVAATESAPAATDETVKEDTATEAGEATDNTQVQATTTSTVGEKTPQVENWSHFYPRDKQPEDVNPDEISIFSPDILPEDSEIFKPRVPADRAEAEAEAEAEFDIEAEQEEPAVSPAIPELECDAITTHATDASIAETDDAPAIEEDLEASATLETTTEIPTNSVEPDAALSTDNQPIDAPFLLSDTTTQEDADDAKKIEEERNEPAAEPTITASFRFDTTINTAEQSETVAKTEIEADPAPTPKGSTAESVDNPEPSLPAKVNDDTSIFSTAETAESAAASAPDPTSETTNSDVELLRLFHEIEQDDSEGQEHTEAEPQATIGEPELIPELPVPALSPITYDPALPNEIQPSQTEEKRIATMTLAEIYTIQGLTQKAIETYRELLAQDPNNTILRSKLESLKKNSDRQ